MTLTVLNRDGEPQERHPLTAEEITLGREEAADIRFPNDPYLSPVHALFIHSEGSLAVRDLGSRNGTWFFLPGPHRLVDGDQLLIGSQILWYRRLGYPGPHPPDADSTRRMGSLTPGADIASLTQLRPDGSARDVMHLSPGRDLAIGRESGDWVFPYDPSMSVEHAVIRSEDADFVVIDAGSRNGIAIAVKGEMHLTNGSRLLMGDALLQVEMP